ncbi:hypothetical protein [Pseudomonas sp. CCC3.1]|uniref:hypothetical protein n=1 Tax=Pseudomonas sp. CCC3.1 TaxID=3048607 RepID=UPI002AC9717D|nr:hypothetical protein [Pseudomonas sp. CCC3.1]MEB0204627.1 hypothetical protein [Pseudomonas sp. CCC3.1]WPX38676.1 hypothetical protein RHM56_11045 [Pseudomonas sp. CCC3.1]
MIKHYVLGLVSVLMLAGCELDKEKVAREKIEALKNVFEASRSGQVDVSATQPITSDSLNRCIVQMVETKAKLDAIQVDYAETPSVQSVETHRLYRNINDQLMTCQETKY